MKKMFFTIMLTALVAGATSFVLAATICGPQGCSPTVVGHPTQLAQATPSLPDGVAIPKKPPKQAIRNGGPGTAEAAGRPLPKERLVMTPNGKLNPWEKGKVYNSDWRKERLAKEGWYVLELYHDGKPYEPRLFEVVGKHDKFAKGMKNLYWETVMVYGKAKGLQKNDKMTARLIIRLDQDDITGIKAGAIMVVPKEASTLKVEEE